MDRPSLNYNLSTNHHIVWKYERDASVHKTKVWLGQFHVLNLHDH